ncbi:MAG: DEAD/DEAH box helicase [Bacteroidaceae bacterium]|nr:DEAD/DEAH box helicase [Bacteroidaceae bacterium]
MGIILNSAQQKALRNLKIEELNEMQQAAIEHCRESKNMVLLSPTGTGKTLAFLLPLLERLNADCRGVQALIVLPTRELAKQVFDVWRSMATSFSVTALYGGRPLEQEIASLGGSSPSLIVGTPGRLLDHLNHASFAVEKCSQLVIDEFDKCLEMGFHEEMQELLGHLPNLTSRFLLSATDADEIPEFAGADNVKKLDFSECDAEPAARTAFYKITTTPEQRLQRLYELLCSFSGEPAIVFCNFRESVEEVRRFLAKERLIVSAYHGALEQKERELALYRFSSGCSNILISTDLAARGLDIKDVKHVIHFQRPMTAEIFTHRNGRTARWEADGSVYMLSYHEHTLPDFVPEEISEYKFPKKLSLPDLPQWSALYIGKGKRDKISRGDIAGFFMKKGGLRSEEVGPIMVLDRYSYAAVRRNRVRELLSVIEGQKIKGLKTIVSVAHN